MGYNSNTTNNISQNVVSNFSSEGPWIRVIDQIHKKIPSLFISTFKDDVV
jgi:hypothetical protein